MIFLGVANLEELEAQEHRLAAKGIPFQTFVEPDIGDQKTALATVANGKTFKGLRLL